MEMPSPFAPARLPAGGAHAALKEPPKVSQHPAILTSPRSSVVRGFLEEREQRLLSYAARSRESNGRDRIPNDKSFHRLKHKTRPFVSRLP